MLEEQWDDNEFPLAYLITVRTYGTWLHGDERGSVDLHGKNIYGSPKISPNRGFAAHMRTEMKSAAFILNAKQRNAVQNEIENVCLHRKYLLHALNVRTNHFHAVVSGQIKPEAIINALKANATRALRDEKLIDRETLVWSRGQSRRYLWKPRSVARAIDYTLNHQGLDLIDFDVWVKNREGSV